jgi:hypothetical protein
MVDIAKATKTLEDYFANATKEQFSEDLRKFCPELFEEEEGQSNGSQDSPVFEEKERPQPADRRLDILTHNEIYQQAKQDSKIEIAAKLLHKGISVNEVAEILELEIEAFASKIDAH